MRVSYSQTVDADGGDAFAEAGLDVELDQVDVLTSDVASDTLLGDQRNGVNLRSSGAAVSDSDSFFFDVVLGPGGVAAVGAVHQWGGGVFVNPGSSNVDMAVDITVDSFLCSGPGCSVGPPAPVVEPATLPLLGLGAAGLALALRRRVPARA